MRPIHLGLAIAAVVAVLVAVWCAVRTDPVEAHGISAPAETREAPRSGEIVEAQGADGSPASAAPESERILLTGATPSAASPAPSARSSAESDIEGRVVDRGGRPVSGADVYAASGSDWVSIPLDVESDSLSRNWVEIEHATTDARGRFVIADLKPGALRLAVRASGFAPRAIEDGFVPEAAPRVLPDIVLEPGVVLTGRVVDPAGRGVRGAILLAALDGSASGQRLALPGRGVPLAETGAEGEFRIDRLGPGPWHLIVDSPEHLVTDAHGATRRAGEEVSGLLLRVEPGAEIEGRIQWAGAGAPVGAASVRVSARPSREPDAGGVTAPGAVVPDPIQSRPRHAPMDASGRFVLRGLVAGLRYRLTAGQPSPDTGRWKSINALEPVLAFAGERGVVLAERPSTALLLRVLDDVSGEPISTLTVAAGVGRERLLRDDANETRQSFPDGRVRVPDLRAQPAGKPIFLRVSATGYRDFQRRDIAFSPGVDVDLGDVRLVREHALVVTVVDDESGAPVEDARVLVGAVDAHELADYFASPPETNFHGLANLRFGRTGADGRVRLSSYPGLSVNVCADARGFRIGEPRAELLPLGADHALELRLKHGGRVAVRVSDPAGRPVARIGIAHRPPGADLVDDPHGSDVEPAEYTNASGVARFEALEPGVHSFRACDGPPDNSEASAFGWVPVTVVDRSSLEVALAAAARGRLSGQVREGGEALALARLRLVERRAQAPDDGGQSGDPALDAASDREGRFVFENVRAAQYDLFIAHPTRRMVARFPVTVLEGDNTSDFELDVASIEGRVVDSDGQPLSRVDVSAALHGERADETRLFDVEIREDERGNPRVETQPTARPSVQTDEQGRYSLRGVLSGQPLVVAVRGETIETATSAPLLLGPGEVRRGFDFVARRAGVLEVSLVGDPPGGSREWFEVRVETLEPAANPAARTTHVGSFMRIQKVRALGPGRYRVRLFPMGNEASERAQAHEVDIAAGQVSKVVFQAR